MGVFMIIVILIYSWVVEFEAQTCIADLLIEHEVKVTGKNL
jgi:hypothetical protein